MRKRLLHALLFTLLASALGPTTLLAQTKSKAPPATLRSILLEQLRSTHNKAEWFVPLNTAVDGLTAEQAKWVPKSNGPGLPEHSVGQLANHVVFWNEQMLAKFKGEKPAKFSGNNDETFNSFDASTWSATVKRLDAVMSAWEAAVEQADDAKLSAQASTIAHIGTHNAYHTGQILYLRKLQGSWDPAKGVR